MEVDYNKFLVKPKHTVVFAFESGGKPFFEYESFNNIPFVRRAAIEDTEEMMNLGRLTAEHIEASCIAYKDARNEGRQLDADKIIDLLHERSTFRITTIDYCYKLASAYFFSYDENPTGYDDERAERKIQFWRKNDDFDTFFLKTKLEERRVSLNTTIENLLHFTRVDRRKAIKEIDYLLSNISLRDEHAGIRNTLASQKATHLNWMQSGL